MVSYVDIVKIKIKAGDGGDGRVAFHKEKYVPNGGPDGGDGGRGGNVFFQAHEGMRTLMDFRFHRVFKAEPGAHGGHGKCTGKGGEDILIRVPPGTIVRDVATGAIIADIIDPNDKRLILRGGKGGAGNARFATAVRQAPQFAKPGERVPEIEVQLEIKSIADVGLVGFPNVGKSTILSVVSAARPRIDNYHFTTLTPNLGVVRVEHDGFVMADIPGLIEGASEGAGLGHAFLRHVERTRMLIHVLDISGYEGRDPLSDYDIIQDELRLYGQLHERPQVIAANKMDLPNAQENLDRLREKLPNALIFPISAATNEGLTPLIRAVMDTLTELPPLPSMEDDFPMPEIAPSNEPAFTVEKEDGWFLVKGPWVDQLVRSVNFQDVDSLAWFERMMRRHGIIDALREKGAKHGDEVRLSDVEFDFVD